VSRLLQQSGVRNERGSILIHVALSTIKNGSVETLSCYRYVNGSTTVADPNATVSPRVVPLPVFDPQLQFQTGQIRMVNILGFFLEPMQDKDLRGILVNNQGCSLAGAEASRHQRRSRP
jgi:hypothetical protein